MEKLDASIRHALADERVQRRLGEIGQDIPAREQQTPQGLHALQQAEADKWWPIIKAAGVRIQ